jgi:hypothetical protein
MGCNAGLYSTSVTYKSRFARNIGVTVSAVAIPSILELVLLTQSSSLIQLLQASHGLALVVQVVACLSIGVVLLSVPRLPDVFYNNKEVDREDRASLLTKFTFNWSGSWQDQTRAIALNDIPSVAYSTRAETISRRYHTTTNGSRLWIRLLRFHFWSFFQQWLLIALKSVLSFSAQICLHTLLQSLEQKSTRSKEPFVWTSCLAMALVLEVLVTGWLDWTTAMKLSMPVVALVKDLVFQKASRRPIGHRNSKENTGSVRGPSSGSEVSQHSEFNLISNDR